MANKLRTQDIYQLALKHLSNGAMFAMLRRALQCCPLCVFRAIQKGLPSQVAYNCVLTAIGLVWEPVSKRTLTSRHAPPAGQPHTAPASGSGTGINSYGTTGTCSPTSAETTDSSNRSSITSSCGICEATSSPDVDSGCPCLETSETTAAFPAEPELQAAIADQPQPQDSNFSVSSATTNIPAAASMLAPIAQLPQLCSDFWEPEPFGDLPCNQPLPDFTPAEVVLNRMMERVDAQAMRDHSKPALGHAFQPCTCEGGFKDPMDSLNSKPYYSTAAQGTSPATATAQPSAPTTAQAPAQSSAQPAASRAPARPSALSACLRTGVPTAVPASFQGILAAKLHKGAARTQHQQRRQL